MVKFVSGTGVCDTKSVDFVETYVLWCAVWLCIVLTPEIIEQRIIILQKFCFINKTIKN